MPIKQPKKDPNAPATDKDLEAAQLFPKVDAALESMLATIKDLGVSDKRANPNWEPNPDDPEETAPLIDTDPPTDVMGKTKKTLEALRPKVKADFKKYNGRTLKNSSADDAFDILTNARKSLIHWHMALLEVRDLLNQEAQQTEQDRRSYYARNKDKAKETAAKARRIGAKKLREAEALEREMQRA